MNVLGIADLASVGVHLGADVLDATHPEIRASTEGNGVNVVSATTHGLMKFLDMAATGIADVRDDVGAGIHDTLASVPLVGPLLGGATDAVGFALDAVAGEGHRMVQGVGRAVTDVSNIAGGFTNKAGYVDSDDIAALDELSEEQMAGMSEREIARQKGLFGYAFDKLGEGVSALFGGGENMPESTVVTGVEQDGPAWYVSAMTASEAGALSEDNLNGLCAGYLAGMYDDQTLTNYMVQSAATGELPDWNTIGAQATKNIEAMGYSVDDYMNSMRATMQAEDVSSGVAYGAYDNASVIGGETEKMSQELIDAQSESSFETVSPGTLAFA